MQRAVYDGIHIVIPVFSQTSAQIEIRESAAQLQVSVIFFMVCFAGNRIIWGQFAAWLIRERIFFQYCCMPGNYLKCHMLEFRYSGKIFFIRVVYHGSSLVIISRIVFKYHIRTAIGKGAVLKIKKLINRSAVADRTADRFAVNKYSLEVSVHLDVIHRIGVEKNADVRMIQHFFENMKRIQAAADIARGKDIVFIFAGLPDEYESEGFDRSHLNLPESHSRLIEETAKVNPNVAVILQGGAPVVMPWLRDVKAVLMCYLAGQAGGEAVCGLLYGSAVPCGKLAETFPLFLSDNPSYPNFGGTGNVEYRESIFVGYRYYDAAEKQVLFPFGHGLSYTVFAYSNLCLSSDTVGAEDTVTVTVDVQNTGMYDAAEIVQIYVQPPESVIFKAKKDLRGFSKIFLKAGETGTVSIALNSRSFAYYNTKMHGWHVEEGTYTVLAGASSRDIRLRKYIHAEAAPCSAAVPDFRHDAPVYYALNKSNPVFTQQQFEAVYGAEMPGTVLPHKGGYHLNATLSEVKGTFAGRILNRNVRRQMAESFKKDPRPDEVRMQQASVDDLPLRALVSFSGGEIGFKMLESLLLMMNGHFFRGLFSLCRSAAKKDADASAVQNQIET